MTNVKKYRDLGRMRPDKLCPGTWARSEYVLHISRCVQRQCVTSPVDFGPSLINYPPFRDYGSNRFGSDEIPKGSGTSESWGDTAGFADT